MISLLFAFALKSVLIAGVTLLLLHLLRDRSAAERSMVAHSGLLALLIVPLGSMLLPQLVIEAPLLSAPAVTSAAAPVATNVAVVSDKVVAAGNAGAVSILDFWPLLYGFPAVILLGLTLVAVLRLLTLRTRASVLVEPSWLSALAYAQRRMNFKHGTALLSSNDLKSPISWGVLRPVILINDEAIAAHGEAEAIIAHELAHVRGLDWAKLLLARIVSAIFWFNPLVWLLAREAHQLREETADDAVLAADVGCTEYAQLLVGVARHECKGMLLGAHGVAPGKNSLSRRVGRVLDGSLPRAPVARGFAAGILLGVIGTAAPLAALTLTARPAPIDTSKPYYVAAEPTASLPSVVARSVADATAITGDVIGKHVSAAITGKDVDGETLDEAIERSVEARLDEAEKQMELAHPRPGPAPRPALGKGKHEANQVAAAAVGVTPEYVARLRAAAPRLRFDEAEFISLRALQVDASWLKAMIAAGFHPRDADDIAGAKAVGLRPAYVAELAAEGYRNLTPDAMTSLRAMGVSGAYIRRLRKSGYSRLSPDRLVELRALGMGSPHKAGKPPGPDWEIRGGGPPDSPPPVPGPPEANDEEE